jgi:hypothetical protein
MAWSGACSRLQRRRVDVVESSAVGDRFAYLPVDFRTWRAIRTNPAAYHDRLAFRLRWIVAFVSDADNLVAESQAEKNLRGGWKKRADAHHSTVLREGGGRSFI